MPLLYLANVEGVGSSKR